MDADAAAVSAPDSRGAGAQMPSEPVGASGATGASAVAIGSSSSDRYPVAIRPSGKSRASVGRPDCAWWAAQGDDAASDGAMDPGRCTNLSGDRDMGCGGGVLGRSPGRGGLGMRVAEGVPGDVTGAVGNGAAGGDRCTNAGCGDAGVASGIDPSGGREAGVCAGADGGCRASRKSAVDGVARGCGRGGGEGAASRSVSRVMPDLRDG